MMVNEKIGVVVDISWGVLLGVVKLRVRDICTYLKGIEAMCYQVVKLITYTMLVYGNRPYCVQ